MKKNINNTIEHKEKSENKIQLPSGSFSLDELIAILNHLPLNITFVDKDDTIKYFSRPVEGVFQREESILNRDLRKCHSNDSMEKVEKVIDDFKNGRKSRAASWKNKDGKMIYTEYIALHNEKGEYLGILEVSQNIQLYRELKGEQRTLSYTK